MPQLLDRLRRRPCRAPERDLQGVDRARGVRGGRASGPRTSSLAEVYDLSTALELDWIEDLGLCKRGEAEQLLRAGDTTIGGRIPVNPSRRAGLLRRGGAGPGARPGLRGDLAAARPGRRAARSRAPGSASPPTRGSSATAPRWCSARLDQFTWLPFPLSVAARQAWRHGHPQPLPELPRQRP